MHNNNNFLEKAEEYLDLAFQLQRQGKLDQAIENYIISIDYHPTAKAYTFLGWALSKKGQLEEAIKYCKLAIDLDPDFGNPYNDIGSYLVALRKFDEAEEWFYKAIDAPNYEPRHYPYYNLGRVYEKKGKWFEAIELFKKALEFQPNYEPANKAITQLTAIMN